MTLGKIRGPFNELARFVRNYMEAHELTVPRLALLLYPVTASRLYDICAGRRTFDGWEVAVWVKRTGVNIPAPYLRGEDPFGAVKKERDPEQMKMERLLEETERAWGNS
jgi:hypothetical protein